MEEENKKVIDVSNKKDEELIEFYSKISENILMLSSLLDKEKKEEAIKKYQKVKNKI